MIESKRLLALVVFAVPLTANAASFDCAKAAREIEKAICASTQVSKLDSDLDAAYRAALVRNLNPEAVKSAQRTWVKVTRDRCQDAACLIKVYQERIIALSPSLQEEEENEANLPPEPSAINLQQPTNTSRKLIKKVEDQADAAQINDGYTLLFTADNTKNWWKRAPELDRNGWKYGLNRVVGKNTKVETDRFPFKCSTNEIGLPLGAGDAGIQWVQIAKGSTLEPSLRFICDSSLTTPSRAAPETVQLSQANLDKKDRTTPRPVGPKQSELQSQALLNVRIGRCAVAPAKAGGYSQAEELMSNSSNRKLTRVTYVALLQRSLKDPEDAKESYMDACYAIGFVNGTDRGAFSDAYMYYLTEYESSHPDALPEESAKAVAKYDAGKEQRDLDAMAVQRAAIENDPVQKLNSAFLAFDARCKTLWSDSTRKLLIQINNLGPRNFSNPESTVERTARGVAGPQLDAIRQTRCAP